MKHLTKTLLSTAILATSMMSASALAEQKIGAINVQGVFQAMPQAATIQQDIAAEFKDKIAAVEAMKKDLEYQAEKLQREAATMSAEQKETLQKEIRSKNAEYAKAAQPLQQSIQRRQQEEQARLLGLINQAVQTVASEGKYDVVLRGESVAFISPEFDVSEQVLEKLKAVK